MAKKKGPTFTLMRKFVESEMDSDFTFNVSAGNGSKVLHRIRVELTRTRNALTSQGYKLKPFKMLHIRTETKDGRDFVTIRKSQTLIQETIEVIPDMLSKAKSVPQLIATGNGNVGIGSQGTDSAIKAGTELK